MGKIMQIFPLHGILSILTDFELTVGVPKAKDLMYVSVFKWFNQLIFTRNATGKVMQFFGLHGISSIMTVLESIVCRCLSDLTTPFSRKSYWQNHANFLITWDFVNFDCIMVYLCSFHQPGNFVHFFSLHFWLQKLTEKTLITKNNF